MRIEITYDKGAITDISAYSQGMTKLTCDELADSLMVRMFGDTDKVTVFLSRELALELHGHIEAASFFPKAPEQVD